MTPFTETGLARLDRRMGEWVEAGAYAGLEWGLGDSGGILHSGRAGGREIGGSMPARPIFRVCSMTKPIVTVALMRLVEEGRAQLFQPVARWLPEWAGATVRQGAMTVPLARPITLYDLATHMAGLSYGFLADDSAKALEAAGIGADPAVSLREESRRIAAVPLASQPGAAWRYSLATDVLGAALEVIEDRPLGDILKARVFGPLGMAETGFAVPEEDRRRLMVPHAGGIDGPARPMDAEPTHPSDDPGWARGGTGLYSTLEDYALFARALLATAAGREAPLVARKTLEWMTANHVPPAALPLRIELPATQGGPGLKGFGFGLGFRVSLGHAGQSLLCGPGEFGWSGAAETWFTVDPREGVFAIFLAQNYDWPGASYDFTNLMNAALA